MTKFFRVTTLAALALGATALTAQAQGTKQYGVLAGVDFSTMSGDDISGTASISNFIGGLYVIIPSSTRFGFEVNALYAGKGVADENDSDTRITTSYIEVPVLARYGFTSVTQGAYLLGGGAVGFNMGCDLESDGGSVSCDDALVETNTTFGIVFGLGYQKGRFGLEGRYDFDLGDALKDVAAKNSAWEIMARVGINK